MDYEKYNTYKYHYRHTVIKKKKKIGNPFCQPCARIGIRVFGVVGTSAHAEQTQEQTQPGVAGSHVSENTFTASVRETCSASQDLHLQFQWHGHHRYWVSCTATLWILSGWQLRFHQ